MTRDLARPTSTGTPSLSEAGWYGLQDGGASSVCGHGALMQIIEYLVSKGVTLDHFLFAARNKIFGFGGDAIVKLIGRSDFRCGFKAVLLAIWNVSLWSETRLCSLADRSSRHSVQCEDVRLAPSHRGRTGRIPTTMS